MKYVILVVLILFVLYEIYSLAVNYKNKKKDIKEEVNEQAAYSEKVENSDNK